jgi:hypothetical protein
MLSKTKTILLSFVVALSSTALAQTPRSKEKTKILTAEEAKEVKKDAGAAFASGDFNASLQGYKDLVKSDPQNKEYNFRLGFSYLKTYSDKRKAADYIEKGIDPKNKTKENIFYLGLAYHYDHRWDEAVEKYQEYKSAGGKQIKGFMDPGRLIEMCENGIELEAETLKVDFESLGKMINSVTDDYNPMISADGRTLVITSRRKGNLGLMNEDLGLFPADVFSSTYRDSIGWSKVKSVGIGINTDRDEEAVGMNPNADQLVLCLDNVDALNDLAVSLVKGKNWQKYALLGPDINNPKTPELSGCISNDGQMLFFTAERKEGQGGADIYMSRKDDNGNWGKPENLGPDINTFYDEKFPFMTADNKTLFFASQGHNSMGGFDIFKIVFDDSTETWSDPVNLGWPINTPDDEFTFAMAGNGRNAYMAMWREGSMGERDVYKLTFHDEKIMPFMTVIKGKANIAGSTKINLKRAELRNKKNGRIVSAFGTDAMGPAGEFVLVAPVGEYELVLTGAGFKEYKEDLSVTEKMVEPMQKQVTITSGK